MRLVRLKYVGPGAVHVFDSARDRGVVLESGAEGEFSEACAADLRRDAPDSWQAEAVPAVTPLLEE